MLLFFYLLNLMIETPPLITTRRRYTYMQKENILKQLFASGKKIEIFAKESNIPLKTLQEWIRKKEKIFSSCIEYSGKRNLGSGKETLIPYNIEMEIVDWFLNVRAFGIPISGKIIKARAAYLIKEKGLDVNLNFSDGWLDKFKKRYNICSRKGGSKIVRSDDCELKVITEFINIIKEKILSGKYESIINIDETGIYYDYPIDYTLDIRATKRVQIKSTGREKERITVVLGIDYLNTTNVIPLIILKGGSEQSLNQVCTSDDYVLSFQKNSWCDEKQFVKFISLLPKNKKILLILDNFKGHKTEYVYKYINDNYPLIEMLSLPPNTTSILQPLDVGINKTFKTYIKEFYLAWLIENFNKNKALPKLPKKLRTNLLVKWIQTSWKNITFELIQKSFEFCGYTENETVTSKWQKYYVIETNNNLIASENNNCHYNNDEHMIKDDIIKNNYDDNSDYCELKNEIIMIKNNIGNVKDDIYKIKDILDKLSDNINEVNNNVNIIKNKIVQSQYKNLK